MWIVLSVIFLLLMLTLVFSFPSMQTRAARYAVSWVNEKYDSHIELGQMRYIFPDEVVLGEVYLPDHRGDTMIYASNINLHFHGFNSLTNTAYSNGVEIENLKFYWVVQPGDSAYNFQMFTDKFKTDDTASSTPFNLQIADIEVKNGIYRYEDLNCDSCFRFYLRDLNLEASAFDLAGQYLTLEMEALQARDEYSVNIKEFQSYFEYQAHHILLEDLEFTTAQSYFDCFLKLNYDTMPDFKDFVNQVVMEGEIKESKLSSKEIQFFAQEFPDFEQFSISGAVEGVVNQMTISDIILDLASQTHFEGNLELKNATTPDNLFMRADKIELETNPKDAQFVYGLFSDTTLPAEMQPLGNIKVMGSFEGYLNNFTTDARVLTDLGDIEAKVYLNMPEVGTPEYRGNVKLKQVEAGKILGDTTLGAITSDLSLNGKGFDPPTMNTKLKGKISSLQYNSYNYQDISIDGKVAGGKFTGQLDINDPNLKLDFDGVASFKKDTSNYNFRANIQMADLHALNFVKDSISFVTAQMDIDMVALNYNAWAGDILIYNSTYENSRNFHFFENVNIHSEGLDTNRSLRLRSTIIDANLEGNYSLAGIGDAFASQVTRFVKTLEPVNPPIGENFNFDIEIKNFRVLSDIFINQLEVEPNTRLFGNYSSDTNAFNVTLNTPGFTYNETNISTLALDFHGSPTRSSLSFDAARLQLKNGFEIDSINLGNFYYNDTLFYDLNWVLQDSIDSRTNLQGYAVQEDSSTFRFGVFESEFNVGLQKFTIPGGNSIVLDTGGIHIEDLKVINEQRAIYVNGNISDDSNEILRLNLKGFGMELANYFIGSQSARFKGDLYGDIILTELLGQPKFAADLRIDSLEMNNTYLGDFSLNSDWAVRNDTINLEALLKTGEVTTFYGKGYYQPDSLGDISFNLEFDRFRLAAFDPLLEGLAQNLRGYLNGTVKVSGNTGTPLINGDLTLPQTAFTVSLLNTDYNFVGTPKVKITPEAIVFPDLKIRDTQYGTEGKVGGEISHSNFSDFKLDLSIDAKELLVLNTTAKTDDPYYGTAFVSGNIGIKGPIDEILVSADVVSAGDTKFYLPIDGATEVNKTGFVSFVDYSKKTDKEEEKQDPVLNPNKGVTIDFNIEVDQSADVSIIVDSEVGNQLVSRGTGNIRLIMKPYSDLEMYGTYTVFDGHYNFVLPVLSQRLLARKFEVLRGGSVTWNGDPLGALISLTARYTTKADPSALLEGTTLGGGSTLTIVDLYLSGELLDPEITFDISAPRAPSSVQTAISNQIANPDNLYTQVFAILALNRFAPNQGLEIGSTSRVLGFSALTNQAANYINMLTGDFAQVSLDYQGNEEVPNGVDIPQQDELELGVSKRFFNDRLNLNTQLGVAVDRKTNQPNQGNPSNQDPFTGDVELEYYITRDGRFRAKAFNRSVQREYSFGEQNYQQGIGIFYRVDFNSFFGKKNNGQATRDEEEDLLQNQGDEEMPIDQNQQNDKDEDEGPPGRE